MRFIYSTTLIPTQHFLKKKKKKFSKCVLIWVFPVCRLAIGVPLKAIYLGMYQHVCRYYLLATYIVRQHKASRQVTFRAYTRLQLRPQVLTKAYHVGENEV